MGVLLDASCDRAAKVIGSRIVINREIE